MNREHIIFCIGFFTGGVLINWTRVVLADLNSKRMNRMAKKVNRYYGTTY